MYSIIRNWILALPAVCIAAFGTNAYAASTKGNPETAIKLQCSGAVTDYDYGVREMPASGIYVEIRNDRMSVFNIPSFPNYHDGIHLQIYKRNPAQIFGKTRDDNIYISVNRMSGIISAWHYYDHQDIKQARAHRMFEGKCINTKPIF